MSGYIPLLVQGPCYARLSDSPKLAGPLLALVTVVGLFAFVTEVWSVTSVMTLVFCDLIRNFS